MSTYFQIFQKEKCFVLFMTCSNFVIVKKSYQEKKISTARSDLCNKLQTNNLSVYGRVCVCVGGEYYFRIKLFRSKQSEMSQINIRVCSTLNKLMGRGKKICHMSLSHVKVGIPPLELGIPPLEKEIDVCSALG